MSGKITENELHLTLRNKIDSSGISKELQQEFDDHKDTKASEVELGHVKIDGKSIVIDESGTISAIDFQKEKRQGFPVNVNEKYEIEDVFKWEFLLKKKIGYKLTFKLHGTHEGVNMVTDVQLDHTNNQRKLMVNNKEYDTQPNYSDIDSEKIIFHLENKDDNYTLIIMNELGHSFINVVETGSNISEIEYNVEFEPNEEFDIHDNLIYYVDTMPNYIKNYIDKKIVDIVFELQKIEQQINSHATKSVMNSEGVHDFRVLDGKAQYLDEDEWINIENIGDNTSSDYGLITESPTRTDDYGGV